MVVSSSETRITTRHLCHQVGGAGYASAITNLTTEPSTGSQAEGSIPSVTVSNAIQKHISSKSMYAARRISGRGFLGLPQKALSAHVLSEPSAVSSDEGGRGSGRWQCTFY